VAGGPNAQLSRATIRSHSRTNIARYNTRTPNSITARPNSKPNSGSPKVLCGWGSGLAFGCMGEHYQQSLGTGGSPSRLSFQWVPAVTKPGSQEEQALIQTEIQELLWKKALEEVPPAPDQFVSHLFLIPKNNGSYCLVFNLKPYKEPTWKA